MYFLYKPGKTQTTYVTSFAMYVSKFLIRKTKQKKHHLSASLVFLFHNHISNQHFTRNLTTWFK